MTFVLSRRPEVGVGQPPGDLVLDKASPYCNGLVLSCYNSVSDMEKPPRNYVNGATGSRANVKSYGPAIGSIPYAGIDSPLEDATDPARRTKIINAAKFNGSTAWAFVPLDLSPYPIVTVALWLAVLTVPASDSALAIEYGASLVSNGLILEPNYNDGTDTGLMAGCGYSGANVNLRTMVGGAVPANEMHHYCLVYRRNTGTYTVNDFLLDGATVQPHFTGTVNNTAFATNGGINIGARNQGASLFSNIAVACLQVWDFAFSKEQSQRYFRNTWQHLRPAVCSVGETA